MRGHGPWRVSQVYELGSDRWPRFCFKNEDDWLAGPGRLWLWLDG